MASVHGTGLQVCRWVRRPGRSQHSSAAMAPADPRLMLEASQRTAQSLPAGPELAPWRSVASTCFWGPGLAALLFGVLMVCWCSKNNSCLAYAALYSTLVKQKSSLASCKYWCKYYCMPALVASDYRALCTQVSRASWSLQETFQLCSHRVHGSSKI